MKKRRFLALCLICFSLMVAIAACNTRLQNQIVIGSKNFTEQLILAEILAQHIEANTNLKVERRLNLGGTFVCHQAIVAGEIDVYVEYTGTAFTAILKKPPISNSQQVYQEVKQAYAKQFQLELTEPLGFNNTFAMLIRGEDARKENIKTLSQAAQKAPEWKAGFGYEFIERKDGFSGLAKTYGLRFSEPPRVMDLGLMYRAIKERQVDLIAGASTDGLIERLDLVVLKDDKQYFPPYYAVPIVRKQTVEKYPQLRQALQQLGGIITEKDMQNLNYQVDAEGKDVKQVAQQFLKSKGLVKN
ncbi:glycine betaine ABC transporter substrate-binding protein [Microseira wollei]|uniref:Substrate-binding region of ABC-type glycine betaine transport system n=1 Tax=Microseira wollei NIES-4236 TaxID=2530354 RepID=A0AAV3XCS0_9CYAN|nr:glycine betaine ABC transporter substrate-binding protein [Microseira wollei]GET37197.1 substrate-binding region of ABC-type glycine betaine transport system [Microseira wollei NIES-4236]